MPPQDLFSSTLFAQIYCSYRSRSSVPLLTTVTASFQSSWHGPGCSLPLYQAHLHCFEPASAWGYACFQRCCHIFPRAFPLRETTSFPAVFIGKTYRLAIISSLPLLEAIQTCMGSSLKGLNPSAKSTIASTRSAILPYVKRSWPRFTYLSRGELLSHITHNLAI